MMSESNNTSQRRGGRIYVKDTHGKCKMRIMLCKDENRPAMTASRTRIGKGQVRNPPEISEIRCCFGILDEYLEAPK